MSRRSISNILLALDVPAKLLPGGAVFLYLGVVVRDGANRKFGYLAKIVYFYINLGSVAPAGCGAAVGR